MSDLEDELREQLASTQQKLNLCQESIKNYRPEKVKDTPENLIPRLGQFPTNAAYFNTVTITHTAKEMQKKEEITQPLAMPTLLGNAANPNASGFNSVHTGVRLTHQQVWRLKGISLGNLVHSLTLAPGEATKVVVQDWSSSQTGNRNESLSQNEASSSSNNDSRAVEEIQNSTAQEALTGSSTNRAKSVSASEGVSLLFISAGAAINNTVATSVNTSNGSKEASVNANQRIQQATEKAAETARTRRASVVKEVSQRDSSATTSRVVANYNHMHALTMMYYEVLEIYEITTEVVRVQPCVFIPFQLMDAKTLLENHAVNLIDAANAAGLDILANAIMVNKQYFHSSLNLPSYLNDISEALQATQNISNYCMQIKMPWQGESDNNIPPAFQESHTAILDNIIELSNNAAALLAQANDINVASKPDSGLDQAVRYLVDALGGRPGMKSTVSSFGGSLQYVERDLLPTYPESTQQEVKAYLTNAKAYFDMLVDTTRSAIDAASKAQASIASLKAVTNVAEQLNPYLEYFNQSVWLKSLTPATVHSLLQNKTHNGASLNTLIDPKPIAITGNLVGFAYSQDDKLDDDLPQQKSTVVVPTGGVFAEAVLGESVAAERIDLTRFWNWQDSPIPLTPPELSPVSTNFSANQMNLTPTDFASFQANLQSSNTLPNPTGLAAMIESMAKGDMFKDMSGKEAAQTLASAVAGYASSSEQKALAIASQNFMKTMDIGEKLATGVLTQGASTLLGGLETLKGTGVLEKMLGLGDDKVSAALDGTSEQDIIEKLKKRPLPEKPKVTKPPDKPLPKTPDEEN